MLKEIDKLKMQLQTETLLSSKTHNNYNDPTFLTGKIDKNTNNLMYSKTITQETVNRDKLTAQELEKQGNQLMDIHHTIGTAEENLTLVQQITDVMKYNDLFYRLKLYVVVILLGLANIIVLFLKFR